MRYTTAARPSPSGPLERALQVLHAQHQPPVALQEGSERLPKLCTQHLLQLASQCMPADIMRQHQGLPVAFSGSQSLQWVHMHVVHLRAGSACFIVCTTPPDPVSGVFGYSWVAALHTLGGVSLRVTLLLANVTCLAWLAIMHCLLPPPSSQSCNPCISENCGDSSQAVQVCTTDSDQVMRDSAESRCYQQLFAWPVPLQPAIHSLPVPLPALQCQECWYWPST